VGVALIGTGVLVLLLDRQTLWKERFSRIALFLVVSCLPLGLWLARNWQLSGTLMGTRAPTRFTLPQNVALTLQTLGNWLFPVAEIRELPGDLLQGAAMAGTLSGAKSAQMSTLWRLLPYWLFAAGYLTVILFSASTVAYDQIGDRLLAPLTIPLCVLAAAGLDALYRRLAQSGWRWVSWIVFSLLCVLVLLLGMTTIVAAQKAAEEGAGGYHRRAWMESPTLVQLGAEGLQPELPIYSNAHDALYLLLGQEASLAPRKRANNEPEDIVAEALRLRSLQCTWPPEGEAWLIWLDRQQRAYLFSPEALSSIAIVSEVARYDDGAIYRVTRCP
jgi:hypothetical protein